MEQIKTFGIQDKELDPAPPATTTRSENYGPAFAAACRMV